RRHRRRRLRGAATRRPRIEVRPRRDARRVPRAGAARGRPGARGARRLPRAARLLSGCVGGGHAPGSNLDRMPDSTSSGTSAPAIDHKPRSRTVTDGIEATTSRGMLRAVGMGDADWNKSQIGIASSWNEITPCNLSLARLAQAAKEGVHAGGGYPLQFGTVSVSDGISMGHERMHFSLVSREVIADSVETVMQAERLDGSVLVAGCDGPIRGGVMGAARLDADSGFPGGGTTGPGCVLLTGGTEKDITIIDSFEAVGGVKAGIMSEADAHAIECA